MKILTWNVGIGSTVTWPWKDINKIIHYDMEFDIVCLQEVRSYISGKHPFSGKGWREKFHVCDTFYNHGKILITMVKKDFCPSPPFFRNISMDGGQPFAQEIKIPSNGCENVFYNVHLCRYKKDPNQRTFRDNQYRVLNVRDDNFVCGDFNDKKPHMLGGRNDLKWEGKGSTHYWSGDPKKIDFICRSMANRPGPTNTVLMSPIAGLIGHYHLPISADATL